MIDMPVDRLRPYLSKGYAYVEFENADEAEKALKHMDGGWWRPMVLGLHAVSISSLNAL